MVQVVLSPVSARHCVTLKGHAWWSCTENHCCIEPSELSHVVYSVNDCDWESQKCEALGHDLWADHIEDVVLVTKDHGEAMAKVASNPAHDCEIVFDDQWAYNASLSPKAKVFRSGLTGS